MGLLGHLFGHDPEKEIPDLLPAIERAVCMVEPSLKQSRGYPGNYRKPVSAALEYARNLARSVPGPVNISREAYASDAFVHALFPSMDFIVDAFCASQALRDYYNKFPAAAELYALMGMRLFEENRVGMDLVGQVVQRDIVQKIVYFTSHTLENPATSENQSREQTAWSLFDSLVGKVLKRVKARKQDKQSLMQEKDLLVAKLRVADSSTRPAYEEKLFKIICRIQAVTSSLELGNYMEDFEAVMLNPEQHLRLAQIPMFLDRMGVRRESTDANQPGAFVFNQLIGFDRRDWVLTMVQCNNFQIESFAARLDKAYRRLSI